MGTQTQPIRTSSKQRSIAFFSGSPGGAFSYEKWQLWRGIFEAAQEGGFNLVYVAGEEFENQTQSVLYDLIGTDNAAGVITWHSFVAPRASQENYQEFIDRYLPLPIVSIERELLRTSNLLVDNAQGVDELLQHLIHTHHYERIAFVGQRNNTTSECREKAFTEILSDHHLFDPGLVGELNVLDQRGLIPGRDYQAVIAHSDHEAVQLVETFSRRGYHVPNDVAITGFNDGRDARGCQPALTTVRLPFRLLGRRAVELLSQRIEGLAPSLAAYAATALPIKLVLRRSCGCLEPMAEQASAGIVSPAESIFPFSQFPRQQLIDDLSHGMGTPIEILANAWAERLFDILSSELERHHTSLADRQPSPEYLQGLSEVLRQAVEEGSNVSRWHEALTSLRQWFLPFIGKDDLNFAEDLWQQARVLVGQTALRSEIHRGWKAAQRADILRKIEDALLFAEDYSEMYDVLAEGLTGLNVPNLYMVLFEDSNQPSGAARLVMAYENGQQVEIPDTEAIFSSRQLLPKFRQDHLPGSNLVVEALQRGEDHIGYLVFIGPPPEDASLCDVYQALRILVSSTLRGIKLRQELHKALQNAVEANQLKSRFLSMVSHELRTPLNLIVGLSEMALRQQNRGKKTSPEMLQQYLEQIYVSGQHLDRLIRDVLDLASSQIGQMSLIFEPVDLTTVLDDACLMGAQLAESKNLHFKVAFPPYIPRVRGDKTRLRQIILNLLSNAVKFTPYGEIILKVEIGEDIITLGVQDTGLGIPKHELDKIFNEFYQSDRSTTRGYGGIGLGLAITQRLVEMHGGMIWAESDGLEGGGSVFKFTLPILNETVSEGSKPNALRNDTVLIITAFTAEARPLYEHLQQHGFTIEIAELDEQGSYLAGLISSPPGAVILDMAPASETGWEIIKILKETPGTLEIPVLFYSLFAEQNAGFVFELDYLTKPVGAEELISALKRYGLKRSQGNGGATIVIIDDEPGILDLHASMVQTELPTCRVFTARNGLQGLELIRQHQPDLVLLDLLMPELDGFGVLNVMQEEQLLRNIPVVILSGQVINESEMRRLNQSVAAVMGKGLFTQAEMLERIECVLSHHKRLGSESQRLVQRGMAFIHENYQTSISRADIANYLCVNEQYLSRCFKNEAGIGPMTYLSRYRIDKAKRLLENGNASITQVAMEIGLSSQSYFSRLFQQETGISPSAYRRGERTATA